MNCMTVMNRMTTNRIHAMAEARPSLENWNPCSYRYTTIVVGALPGPPPVSTYAWVKTWNDEIRVSTTAKKMDGVINGNTIRKKRAAGLAPSIVAASVRLVGTASSAAEKTSMLYPKPCQMDSRTTAGMAQV